MKRNQGLRSTIIAFDALQRRAQAMNATAIFSRCGKYRYLLTRSWADGPTATFIMLNPSTAGAEQNDPTIRKCIGFAQRLGFGGLQAINLFALRTPSPVILRKARRPIGPGNQAAWGNAMAVQQS